MVDKKNKLNIGFGVKICARFCSQLSLGVDVNGECDNDVVVIRENNSTGRVLNTLCGSQLPSNSTRAQRLWVEFTSDAVNTDGGFTAQYAARKYYSVFVLVQCEYMYQ